MKKFINNLKKIFVFLISMIIFIFTFKWIRSFKSYKVKESERRTEKFKQVAEMIRHIEQLAKDIQFLKDSNYFKVKKIKLSNSEYIREMKKIQDSFQDVHLAACVMSNFIRNSPKLFEKYKKYSDEINQLMREMLANKKAIKEDLKDGKKIPMEKGRTVKE